MSIALPVEQKWKETFAESVENHRPNVVVKSEPFLGKNGLYFLLELVTFFAMGVMFFLWLPRIFEYTETEFIRYSHCTKAKRSQQTEWAWADRNPEDAPGYAHRKRFIAFMNKVI